MEDIQKIITIFKEKNMGKIMEALKETMEGNVPSINQEDLDNLARTFAMARQQVAVDRDQTKAVLDLEEKIFGFIFSELKKYETTGENVENTKDE